MSPFDTPYLFRATAIDGEDDPWIAQGIHLRIHVSSLLGAPVHPFVAWPLRSAHEVQPELLDVRWTTADGSTLPPGMIDVTQSGTILGSVSGTNGEPRPSGWCFLRVDGDPGLQVDWLAQAVRPWGIPVLGVRHQPVYAFGGMGLGLIRASGEGQIFEVHGLNVDQLELEDLGEPEILSLPVQGSPWYANAPGRNVLSEAKHRVAVGEILQFGPPDSPDGALPPMGIVTDVDRVFTSLKPDHLDAWLDTAFMGPDAPGSTRRTIAGTDPNRRADAHLNAWDMILTMAADPVIARYLGLGAVVDPIHQDEGRPLIWLVAGQFALSDLVDRRLTQAGTILDQVGHEHGFHAFISSRLEDMFPDASAVRERIANQSSPPDGGHWGFVTLYTLAVAVARTPADPPPAPVVAAARSEWNGGAGSGTWRQTLALPSQPPAGSLGFARLNPGGPVSLHEHLPGYGAAVLLANWSRAAPDPASNFETTLFAAGGGLTWTPPVVTDNRVPEGMNPGAWRLWQSDEFGRWSDASDAFVGQPARPVASAPAPELHFTPQTAAGDGPASPGTLSIRIDLPKADALPPGARPIAAVDIAVDGAPQSQAVGPGQTRADSTAVVAPTRPGSSRVVQVTAVFRDTDGRVSLVGEAQREVFDPRPVIPNPTAPVLVWAGRVDPTGLAELSLTWPAANLQTGYRVYLGDERRLAKALSIPEGVLQGTAQNPPHRLHHTRALAADKISEADRAQELADKGQFTLLNETPVKPAANGVVTFQHRLPGGLRGVQFLRIVPVTRAGAEAPFGKCGLVPVAVPLEERPPAPTVDVHAEDGGVRIRVRAYGLDADMLARFGHPGSGIAPQFRVRRGRSGVQDPVYMPIVKEGDLKPPPAGSPPGTPWTAEYVENEAATPAFVPQTWVAEVRFPPEPVQAEANADPGPLAVRPLFGPFGRDAESRWSAPSLPASTTRVPPSVPLAPATLAAVKQANGTVKLSVGGLPVGHPKVMAPYQIAVWKWVADIAGPRMSGEAPATVGVVPGQQAVEHVDAAGDAVAFSVAVIDPLGRLGAASEVHVPPFPPLPFQPPLISIISITPEFFELLIVSWQILSPVHEEVLGDYVFHLDVGLIPLSVDVPLNQAVEVDPDFQSFPHSAISISPLLRIKNTQEYGFYMPNMPVEIDVRLTDPLGQTASSHAKS